ncbi:MAG: glycerol-3-phosphate acyltransferase [Clostridia bacterium]|nr:glycerol-3-phosphate acyltransferase [Clostridia bacterium]
MIITVMLVVTAVISYCLGCINGAIITSVKFFHKDIRSCGSGNAGLANFYRNFGVKGLLMVAGIDIAKGIIAAMLGGWLLGLVSDYAVIGKLFAAFCMVLGHVYPVFYEFRGGKGILGGVAAVFWVDWRVGIICMVVFLIALIFSRYISLGSILGSVAFPVSLVAFGYPWLAVVLALMSVAVMLLRHIENIKRIIARTEPVFEIKKNVTHKLDEDF